MDENKKALSEFLLDIDCLEPLADWTQKFNLFDILKIAEAEIRHSNILAWLLDPNENHGLSDRIIKGVVQYGVSVSEKLKPDVFKLLLMEYHDFVVLREWKHIDILAISESEKFVVCIENKVFSGEGQNQLDRYKEVVDKTYPHHTKLFFYLTPIGAESSDVENWLSISYQDILEIIESAKRKVNLDKGVNLLVENYIDSVRRVLVGDENLEKICRDIYFKHKQALDLIYEHKPDKASDIADIFRNWAIEKTEGKEIDVDLNKCVKTYTRFKTPYMSKLFPDSEIANSAWKTKNYYFYEICNNDGNKFHIQLVLSSKNMSEELKELSEKIIKVSHDRVQKKDWVYNTIFRTDAIDIDDEYDEAKIVEQLNEKLLKAKAYEARLKEEPALDHQNYSV